MWNKHSQLLSCDGFWNAGQKAPILSLHPLVSQPSLPFSTCPPDALRLLHLSQSPPSLSLPGTPSFPAVNPLQTFPVLEPPCPPTRALQSIFQSLLRNNLPYCVFAFHASDLQPAWNRQHWNLKLFMGGRFRNCPIVCIWVILSCCLALSSLISDETNNNSSTCYIILERIKANTD